MHLLNWLLVTLLLPQVVYSSAPKIEELSVKDYVIERLMKEDIDPIKADKVIFCESSWNPQAVHGNKDGSVDLGLFQLNSRIYTDISNADKLDYKKSTEYAIKLIKKSGFKPWICNKLVKQI